MTAHRLLVIARRFRGPPTSGNGGYTCGMLAAAASKPVEVRLAKPPPLDSRLEIVDDPVTGGLKLMDGAETVATATPKNFELEVPRPPTYAEALAAAGNYEGFQAHAYSDCFVCGPAALVHEVPRMLREIGVAPQRIRVEEWTAPRSSGG